MSIGPLLSLCPLFHKCWSEMPTLPGWWTSWGCSLWLSQRAAPGLWRHSRCSFLLGDCRCVPHGHHLSAVRANGNREQLMVSKACSPLPSSSTHGCLSPHNDCKQQYTEWLQKKCQCGIHKKRQFYNIYLQRLFTILGWAVTPWITEELSKQVHPYIYH